MPTVKQLSQTHPDYRKECLEVWEALYKGGEEWHERVDHFLPRNPQEPGDVWDARKKHAAYINDAAPIVDLMVAWLFSAPPTVEGLPGSGVSEGWETDVDRAGLSFASYFRDVITDAMRDRVAYTWVNLPPAPAAGYPDRQAQELAGGNRAYLLDLDAEQVINWGDDAEGNLAWLVVKDCVRRQDDALADAVEVHRWTVIDRTRIRRWEWTPRTAPDGTVQREPRPEEDVGAPTVDIAHGFPSTPVVRLRLPAGLHVLGKIEDVCTALARADNDLGWALHRGAHELMVIRSDDPASPPVLGAGYYLTIGPKDSVDYASPTGRVYDALAARVTDLREQAYRSVQQMAQSVSSKSTQARASAASKTLDWQALAIMLDAYGEILKVAIRRTLDLVSAVMLAPGQLTVAGLDGWSEEDLNEILSNASLAVPLVPSPTFKREVAKRIARTALPDLDESLSKAIEGELDAEAFTDPAAYVPPPFTPGAA